MKPPTNFFLALFVLCFLSSVALASTPPSQVAALEAFYANAGGEGWFNSNGWSHSDESDPCIDAWYGVACDQYDNVDSINLSENNLTGSISPLFASLPNVRAIQLWNNNLTGHVPSFGEASNLGVFDVHNNSLSGTIPEFPKYVNELNFNLNSLGGTLPQSLANLTQLNYLGLMGNNIEGNITVLSNLPFLSTLVLEDNALIGDVFEVLVTLNALNLFDGDTNGFEGTIPDSFGSLANMGYLSCASNAISGSIPQSFGTLTSLTFLDLSDNRLSGTIPESIVKMSSLVDVYLNNNFLTGPLNNEFGSNQPNLQNLDLQFNMLTGPISPALALPKSLVNLNLGSNRFTGMVPFQICDLQVFNYSSFLGRLTLSQNQLSLLPSRCCDNLNADFTENPWICECCEEGPYDGSYSASGSYDY